MLCAAACLAGATVASAAPAPTIGAKERPALALSGRALAIAESGAVKLPTFAYHRTRVSTVRLSRNRLGFGGRPQRKIVIRTSIGPLASAKLALSRQGAILAGAGGRGFAGPVVWCCTADGEERVVYSDGRPDAGKPISLAFQGSTARALVGSGRNLAILERERDGTVHREDFTATTFAPYALGATRLASINGPGSATAPTFAISARNGPIALPSALFAGPGPNGRITGMWMDGDSVVALVRRGRLWELYRYTAPERRRLLLRSTTRPRGVAVGRGAVAVAAERTIWTGRGNRRLRKGPRATTPVTALAVDVDRVAWLERRGRGAKAVQRLRMGRVR